LIQFGTLEVDAQSSSQIEIVNLVFPDSTVANSYFTISGTFVNTGDEEFNGDLGIEIETSNGFTGSSSLFLTGDSHYTNVSLNPGEQFYFTTGVTSATTTPGSTENIAIVFPKINNSVNTMSPVIKNLVIHNSISESGN